MTVLLVLWQLGLEIGYFCDTSFFLKSSRFSGYPNHVLGFSGWPAFPVQFHNAFKISPDYTVLSVSWATYEYVWGTVGKLLASGWPPDRKFCVFCPPRSHSERRAAGASMIYLRVRVVKMSISLFVGRRNGRKLIAVGVISVYRVLLMM